MKDDIAVKSVAKPYLPALGADGRFARSVKPKPYPVVDDAVKVDVGKAKDTKVYGYDKNDCYRPVKPQPVEPVKPAPIDDPQFKGLYRNEEDGGTLVAFDGIYLKIQKDGTVEGTIYPPKGEKICGKGTFQDGKIVMTFEKIGTYSGQLQFVPGSDNKIADGTVVLSQVRHLGAPPPPPPPKYVADPVAGVVSDVAVQVAKDADKLQEPVASANGFRGRVSHGGNLGPGVKVDTDSLGDVFGADDGKKVD